MKKLLIIIQIYLNLSQLYEDAHRNGNIYHPFYLKQIKKSNSSLIIDKN